jgi:hypothetical protein
MNNALIIYDNFPENFSDVEYKLRIKNITDFYINVPKNFIIFRTNDPNSVLNKLSASQYQYVFINLLGHFVHINTAYQEIIDSMIQEDCPIMGHIVYYPNSYPCLDNQFICLDLEKWIQLNRPQFDLEPFSMNFKSYEILRSEENFHDDYTPFWVKADTNSTTEHKAYHNFSLQLCKTYLESGYKISNFNNSIREKKANLYAIPNYEKNKNFFQSKIYEEPPPDIFKNILDEYVRLDNTIYVLNSENINLHKTFNKPIDTYVGVASGFKHLLLLNWLGFTPNTEIIFTDISFAALDYQRYLIENWDGNLENYYQISKIYQDKFPYIKYAWRSWNGWDNEINMFLSQANMSKAEFAELWEKYCNLKHSFIELNLLENTKSLTNLLSSKNNQNIYIWLSNAFKMQWTVFFLNQSDVEQNFNNLLDDLKNTTNHYIIEANQFYTVN